MGGMRPYIVRQGEYLAKIAFEQGFDADKVWKHEKNKGLRETGRSPDELAPGDVLFIPNDGPARTKVQLEADNHVGTTVPRVTLHLAICVGDDLVTGTPFEVRGAGFEAKGVTTADGGVEISVPVTARDCELLIPDEDLVLAVAVGGLDPVAERSGELQRLTNLGCLPGDAFDDDGAVARGIRLFQRSRGLPLTGAMDHDTREALATGHGR